MGRKTDSDPTGQATNRKRADVALRKRLRVARKRVFELLKRIPYTKKRDEVIVNLVRQGQIIYQYDIGETDIAAIYDRIVAIFQEAFGTGAAQMPPNWFYQEYIENPYRNGTFEDLHTINRLVAEAERLGLIETGFIERELQDIRVTTLPAYQNGLRSEYNVGYTQVKTLGQATAKQVYDQMWQGIQSGDSPRKIAESVSERFGVSESNAKRIAHTGVNTAYNNAKLRLSEIASEELGVRIGDMHISALLTTTRVDHARRHGLVFTPTAQLQWWNTGTNRINCHCTTEKMIINPETGRVLNVKRQEEVQAQGKRYFGISE